MQALFPTYATPADRLRRYRQLLAGLRGVDSNAEHDDVPVAMEIDRMKFWMTDELVAVTGTGLTYEAAPKYIHRHALDCVITSTHLLRLWSNRPSVLQGSSAAARLVTAVILTYVGAPWVGPSQAKARRHALTPGFLAAYAAACKGLAADLGKARRADVPQHIADMVVVLLWLWRAAMQSFDTGDALSDPAMKTVLLPVVQLAVAALRCWAGSTTVVERGISQGRAIDAAVDVSVLLAKGASDITNSLMRQHSGGAMVTLMHKGVAELHEVQWLLCCYAALIAQELHQQLQGRQPAVLPASGTTKYAEQQQQQQQQAGQQQQQGRVKVAPVHKRLLEGLCVPGLIGWQYAGHSSSLVWQEPEARSAVLACCVFNSLLAYVDESTNRIISSSSRVQQLTWQPPLLSATVHLRRAAVLLELCLLFPEQHIFVLSLQVIQKEVECMHYCLLEEAGSSKAAWTRVYAAVMSGIMPTILQQLLPLLTRMLQLAEQEAAAGVTGYSRAAAELGITLANLVPGPHCPQQQLFAAMQHPGSVRALESSVRCWMQVHAEDPGCLREPHQDFTLAQRLAGVLTAPQLACAQSLAGAATVNPAGIYASSERFALCVTCLKACVVAAGERAADGPKPAAASSGLPSSSSVFCYQRISSALLEAMLTADAAMSACNGLSSSSSSSGSSSSRAVMLPAWQLLLAHSVHATGCMLLALHHDGVLPAASQQHRRQAGVLTLLGHLSAALAAVPAQLASTRCASAASAAAVAAQKPVQSAQQGSAQQNDPCLGLLQQQESLSGSLEQLLSADTSSSSSHVHDVPSSVEDSSQEMMMFLKASVSASLAQQLIEFGASLSGCFPCKLCCNAPGCTNVPKFSELDAVGGKSCMCGRCKAARYCSRGCQEAHWKAHRHACRALAAQQQAQ